MVNRDTADKTLAIMEEFVGMVQAINESSDQIPADINTEFLKNLGECITASLDTYLNLIVPKNGDLRFGSQVALETSLTATLAIRTTIDMVQKDADRLLSKCLTMAKAEGIKVPTKIETPYCTIELHEVKDGDLAELKRYLQEEATKKNAEKEALQPHVTH